MTTVTALTELETERLLLRHWRAEDRLPFARLNEDPVVMEYMPKSLTRAESDAFADRIEAQFASDGWGLWAVEVKGGPEFIGYVGLWPASFEAAFTPAVEIGWRLAADQWGRGYAPEGARAVLDDGFNRLGLDEILSFTATTNVRSQRVMDKIGMRHDPSDDFDHPALAVHSPLRRHVLYRLTRTEWRNGPHSSSGMKS
jgi:RimJ/RimL family protein N-acetyltransferase